ncbi:Serine-threonine/tyrosine-protein kinase [Theobroma cacao]|nr:Serine-threonine/tyrosine-protein kinase [Theobroma cacao]
MGYIAPEVLSRNFGNVSYKSDIYSFGMLLLEMVGGTKNIDVTEENTNWTPLDFQNPKIVRTITK